MLDKDAIAARIEACASGHDKAELTRFFNAMVKSMAAYEADPTASRLKDYEANRDALRRKIDELDAAAAAASAPPPAFESLHAAVKHLQDAGYKIKKSKIYQDKARGLIRVNADGTVLESEIRGYAAGLEKVADRTGEVEKSVADRAAKEVEKLTIQIEKLKLDFEKDKGRYLLKSEVETDLALRCAVFEAGIKHTLQTKMPELVRLVDGKAERSQPAIDLLFGAIDGLLNDYARAEAVEVEA
jgi:hypothetical protein